MNEVEIIRLPCKSKVSNLQHWLLIILGEKKVLFQGW